MCVFLAGKKKKGSFSFKKIAELLFDSNCIDFASWLILSKKKLQKSVACKFFLTKLTL